MHIILYTHITLRVKVTRLLVKYSLLDDSLTVRLSLLMSWETSGCCGCCLARLRRNNFLMSIMMASGTSFEYPDERTRYMNRTACVHWTNANYNIAVIKFIYI